MSKGGHGKSGPEKIDARMVNPTEQQVKDFAAINAIPEKIAETYWMNFEAQDWVRANSQKITNWQIHFKWWFQNECWKKDQGRQKLFPIKGKTCRCGMPAVYVDRSGNYDHFYCEECMPDKVKKKYC